MENDTLELINPTSISGHTESVASKVLFTFNVARDEEIITCNEEIITELLESVPEQNNTNSDLLKSPIFSISENGSIINDELDLSVPCAQTSINNYEYYSTASEK